ncbi:uncharacterized protein [Elaeis guineensis]|uniref:uncharacterized protein n=1 Tax=Elaeis guineensis var. tenera TaxID=51953 RepID=UPI003C6D7FB4
MAVRLSEFDIQYRSRPALKAQVLADFVIECPTTDRPSEEESPMEVGTSDCDPILAWVLHINGASNLEGAGPVSCSQLRRSGYRARPLIRLQGSNNQAEYEALVVGLRLALELGVDRLKVFSDSQLIVGQIKGEFEMRDPTMAKYHQKGEAKRFRPGDLVLRKAEVSKPLDRGKLSRTGRDPTR